MPEDPGELQFRSEQQLDEFMAEVRKASKFSDDKALEYSERLKDFQDKINAPDAMAEDTQRERQILDEFSAASAAADEKAHRLRQRSNELKRNMKRIPKFQRQLMEARKHLAEMEQRAETLGPPQGPGKRLMLGSPKEFQRRLAEYRLATARTKLEGLEKRIDEKLNPPGLQKGAPQRAQEALILRNYEIVYKKKFDPNDPQAVRRYRKRGWHR